MSEVRGANTLAIPFSPPRVRPAKALQYELNVVAAHAVDVVSGIGGWLFDRAMAGWRVSVAVDDIGDERALRILGLKAVGLKALWRSPEADAVAMTAIGTSRFESGDHGLAVHGPVGDVVFFGSHAPDGVDAQIVQYRLSAAAMAFKARALATAGGDPGTVGRAETLYRCGRSACLLDADLVPVR